MPATAAPPPAAPAKPASPPPAAPAKPAPAPAKIDGPPASIKTPEGRRGAVWDSIRGDLNKAANVPEPEPKAPRPGTEEPHQPPPAKPADKSTDQKPAAQTQEPADGQPAVDPKAQPDPKKASPWKLVDQFKARALKAEAELLELSKRALPEEQWKATQEKLANAEKRLKDHEDELRFTNYQKSEEFKSKYQEPYERAWGKAITDLSDLSITDANGNARKFTAEDMLTLLNGGLVESRKLAEEWFGPAAPDVLARRDKIRDAHESMQAALDDAKKNGASREKELMEKRQGAFKETAGVVRNAFQEATKQILSHPVHSKWLTPTDGDDEGNALLEKGYAFARDAFNAKPLAEGLSPEQRADAARKHAALINRAAAYRRLVAAVDKRDARIKELETALGEYESSVPGNGAPSGGPAAGEPNDARSQVFGALRKIAK